MESFVEQALLYDFYGELLTPHQQRIYEDAVCNDMSLGEIAAEQGISRQGVHDLIKRCDKILAGYESKLHLVERFTSAKEMLRSLEALTHIDDTVDADGYAERLSEIRKIAGDLMKEL